MLTKPVTLTIDGIDIHFKTEYEGVIDDLAFKFKGTNLSFRRMENKEGMLTLSKRLVKDVSIEITNALRTARQHLFIENLDVTNRTILGRRFWYENNVLYLKSTEGRVIPLKQNSLFRQVIEQNMSERLAS